MPKRPAPHPAESLNSLGKPVVVELFRLASVAYGLWLTVPAVTDSTYSDPISLLAAAGLINGLSAAAASVASIAGHVRVGARATAALLTARCRVAHGCGLADAAAEIRSSTPSELRALAAALKCAPTVMAPARPSDTALAIALARTPAIPRRLLVAVLVTSLLSR